MGGVARGMTEFNPLNLEYRDDQPNVRRGNSRFGVYPDMPSGVASNLRQLLIDQDAGLTSIEQHVRKWVNDPRADLRPYIADLSNALGVRSDAPINLRDPNVAEKYFMAAQPHESGPTSLSPDDVKKGITMALPETGPPIPKGGLLDGYMNPAAPANPPAQTAPAQPAAPEGDPIPKGGLLHTYMGTASPDVAQNTENPPTWRESFRAGVEHAMRSNPVYQWAERNFPALKQSDAETGYTPLTNDQYKARYGDSLAAGVGELGTNLLMTAPITVPTGMAAETLAARLAAPAVKTVISSADIAPLTGPLSTVAKTVQTAAGSPWLANALRIAGGGAMGAEESKLTGGSATLGALGGAGFGAAGLGASALGPLYNAAANKSLLWKYLPDAVGGWLGYKYGGPALSAVSEFADPFLAAATGAGVGDALKRVGTSVMTRLGPYAPYLAPATGGMTNNVISPLMDPSYLPP